MGANLSGWFDGQTHVLPIRVYYADTDAGGLVYHSIYLDFAERARTEMLRAMDLWPPQDILFVVRACEIDYKRSARLDDLLQLRTTLIEMGGASFRIGQEVWRGDEMLVGLNITVVCLRGIGHPVRIPGPMRERMGNYLRRNK